METKCIIALGNPGKEYAATRHNVAQWVFSELGKHSNLNWEIKQKLFAEICFWIPDRVGEKLMLVRPTVYMNESGKTVNNVCAYFSINVNQIMVIHDELDLIPGAAKIQLGGGAAGHNGILDIYRSLGQQNFKRVRIGIGHPGSAKNVSGWVLSKASATDQAAIEASTESAINALPLLLDGEDVKAMTALHSESFVTTPSQED